MGVGRGEPPPRPPMVVVVVMVMATAVVVGGLAILLPALRGPSSSSWASSSTSRNLGAKDGRYKAKEGRPAPGEEVGTAVRMWRDIGVSQFGLLEAVEEERGAAEEAFRRGEGFLWFHHMAKAGGSSICKILRLSSLGWYQDHRNCNFIEFDAKEPVGYHPGLILMAEPRGTDFIVDTIRGLRGCSANTGCRAVTSEARFIPADGITMLLEPPVRSLSMAGLSHFVFISNFRDPVERLGSAYRYPNYRLQQQCRTLEACVTSVFSEPQWRNVYVRQLVGQNFGPEEAETARVLFRKPLDQPSDMLHEVDQSDLNLAKALLHRFSVLIMTDTFNRDICVLSEVLGITGLQGIRENVTRGRRTMAPETRQALADLNSFDMELYEYAKQLSDARAAFYPACLALDY